MPFALEEIRKLGRNGHRVFASDTFRTSPGNHSKYVEQRLITASPRHETARFLDDLEAIIVRHRIERVIPAFEEVFYIARHRERFQRHAEIFAPSFEVLARMHDKLRFIEFVRDLDIPVPPTLVACDRAELRAATAQFPRFFARAIYSRGGVTLYTNAGPLAGAVSLEDCEPTRQNPFIVQPFMRGLDYCSFSIAHHGRLAAHSTYIHPKTLEHAGGIVFESVEHPKTLEYSRRIAEASGYHGQFSIDYLQSQDDGRLYIVECNPRPTAGVAVLPDDMFIDGLLNRRPQETLVAPAGKRRQIAVALIRDMILNWKEIPSDVEELVSGARDIYADPDDILPALYQFLSYSHVVGYRLKTGKFDRTDLMAAYFEDICWNGEPIA